MQTGEAAKEIWGKKLYQERARKALPILVRQAFSGSEITYENLAEELEMPNPRNLNFVLGSVGKSIQSLGNELGEPIPPIQCLVVNKNTGLPGEGIGWFIKDKDLDSYGNLSISQKRRVVKDKLASIYSYQEWNKVLQLLNLKPADENFDDYISSATKYGGGEGPEHKALKGFVANNPEIINLPRKAKPGKIEYDLPSGDSIDVYFNVNGEEIGVEVKPSTSPESDIVRGMYQCIKYKAVLEARQLTKFLTKNSRTILVLGGGFPPHLSSIRNMLGIEVIDNVDVKIGVQVLYADPACSAPLGR